MNIPGYLKVIISSAIILTGVLLLRSVLLKDIERQLGPVMNPIPGAVQPDSSLLARDGKAIVSGLENNIETYRMYHRYDLKKGTPEYEEYYKNLPLFVRYNSTFFSILTSYGHENNKIRVFSNPTDKNLKVSIDTVIYTQSRDTCFATVVTEFLNIEDPDFVNTEYKFTPLAVIAFRDSTSDDFDVYPICSGKVLSYKDAVRDIRGRFFNDYRNYPAKDFFKEKISGEYFELNKDSLPSYICLYEFSVTDNDY